MGLLDAFKSTPFPWCILTAPTRLTVVSLESDYSDGFTDRLFKLFAQHASLPAHSSIETTVPRVGMIVEYFTIGYAKLASHDWLGRFPGTPALTRRYFCEYNDGFIFVVDARNEHVQWSELARVVSGEDMVGKPVLCLLLMEHEGGVQDAIGKEEVEQALDRAWDLSEYMKKFENDLYESWKDEKGEVNVRVSWGREVKVQECSLGDWHSIQEGLEWLLQRVEEQRVKGGEGKGWLPWAFERTKFSARESRAVQHK